MPDLSRRSLFGMASDAALAPAAAASQLKPAATFWDGDVLWVDGQPFIATTYGWRGTSWATPDTRDHARG